MKNITINESNYIKFDDTEWNSRVLGYETNEIYEIQFDSDDNGEKLFNTFESYCSENKIKYTSLRINPNSRIKKQLLENFGYINVETSILAESNFKKIKENKILEKFDFNLREFQDSDIDNLKLISSTQFNHGRFFEDPMISPDVAKLRNSNWIDDLSKKSKILVGEKDNVIFGFMAFKNDEPYSSLELGGVNFVYSYLAYSFWYRVFEYLKNKNIKSVRAMISAHNLNVINLYSYFGFKFTNSYIGYRKIRDKDVF
jgi:hypothetical protein